MLIRVDHFLPLEAKVENDSQMAGIRDHDRQVLFGDIGEKSQQEPFGIGGGESNANVFRDG